MPILVLHNKWMLPKKLLEGVRQKILKEISNKVLDEMSGILPTNPTKFIRILESIAQRIPAEIHKESLDKFLKESSIFYDFVKECLEKFSNQFFKETSWWILEKNGQLKTRWNSRNFWTYNKLFVKSLKQSWKIFPENIWRNSLRNIPKKSSRHSRKTPWRNFHWKTWKNAR